MDIINTHFKQFYPADWSDRSQFEFTTLLGGMERYAYKKGVSNIFPQIECADGFTVSVQGHCGAYSTPRDDFAEHYSAVECGFPSACEALLMPYIDGDETTDPTQTVYGYVPVEVVVAVIEKHGGLNPTTPLTPSPEKE